MKDIIEKETSVNTKEIEALKKNFPSCFDIDGNFNIEKFTKLISKDTNLIKDSYSLDWLGKSYSRALVNTPVTTLLSEDLVHNTKQTNVNTENLYIEGDNLEVLKHFSNAYSGKIQCIYIDPPYNTGKDGFIYQDDRKFSVEELSQIANIDEDEAKRILDFTTSKSNSHSAWLTFIYPRLRIAHELLREEGVIFISIDDNEQAQLKLLCDDIFGENNFISSFIWERAFSPVNMNKFSSQAHDNILCYGKNISSTKWYGLKRTNDANGRYSNPDNDPRGDWMSSDFSVGPRIESKCYDIVTPSGRIVSPPNGRCWRSSEDKFNELLKENRIWFGADGNGVPRTKRFFSDVKQSITPMTIWKHTDVDHSQTATKELNSLFGGVALFNYPKPVRLISRILELSTSNNDYVLDFFSGSATTAQAVMQLNAQDNGNRKYIMVQLPESINEKTTKVSYDFCKENNLEPIIPSIAKERIKRAAKKIKEETNANIDYGFKVFKTKALEHSNYLEELKTFDPTQLSIIPENNLTSEDLYNLAITWKTHDGIALTTPLKLYSLNSYEALYVENKLYLMYQGFSTSELKRLLEINDSDEDIVINSVVLYAPNFTSKDIKELKEGITMVNKKNANIELEMRY